MAAPIITDGTQERVRKAPQVVLPAGASLFGERAARFDALARGSSLGPYLRLLASVSRGQQQAFGTSAGKPLSDDALRMSRQHGMPPLSAQAHARDAQWLDDLKGILARVRAEQEAAPEVIQSVERLSAQSAPAIEALADRILAGATEDDDANLVPFVGAALQVYFTRLAQTLKVDDVAGFDVPTVCPCCGMRPVASVIRLGGEQANLRYLVCSLCHAEWNMPRVKCTACESDKGLGYLALEAEGHKLGDGPVRAEACDECHTYLKLFHQEKDPLLDPVADDLATLTLDLLVDEQGYARTGPNLLFHPGSA